VQSPFESWVLVSTSSWNRARYFCCPGVSGWAMAGRTNIPASRHAVRVRFMNALLGNPTDLTVKKESWRTYETIYEAEQNATYFQSVSGDSRLEVSMSIT